MHKKIFGFLLILSMDIFADVKYNTFNDTGIVEKNETTFRCRLIKQVRDTGIAVLMLSYLRIPVRISTHSGHINSIQPDLWPGNTGHDRRPETEDLIYGLKQKAEYRMCQGPASDTFVFADRASCINVSEEVLEWRA